MTDYMKYAGNIQSSAMINLATALAILRTEVDETDIAFQGNAVIVRGRRFSLHSIEDRTVLAVLMADDEFGFAVSGIENMAKELRDMQKRWSDAAEDLGFTAARKAEVAAARAA